MDLQFLTWNVTGIMSTASQLCDVMEGGNIDIVGISEHWLTPSNQHFLGSLSSDYEYTAVCDDNNEKGSRGKLGKGGVSIMWHKRLTDRVQPLDIDDHRVIGIKLQLSPNNVMFIFQVYMPCTNHSLDTFKRHLNMLYDLYNCYQDQGYVIFMGDFNASVCRKTPRSRDRLLSTFLSDCNMCAINTMNNFSCITNTFVSYDGTMYTAIDYILVPQECLDFVSHCEVATDECLVYSRHRPILCCLTLTLELCRPVIAFNDASGKWNETINWK